jgi:hypothetical protein
MVWGWLLLGSALVALATGAFAAWWAGPALVGGVVTLVLGRRPESLLFCGSLLWALALTGLPLAGRPAPLVSTALAFAGTRALYSWRKTQVHGRRGQSVGSGHHTAGRTPSFLVGALAWTCGLGGAAVLFLVWTGRLQMFPALDGALASTQIGAAAGLTAAAGGATATWARRLVLLPLGLSIFSLSVLFWWFVLSA